MEVQLVESGRCAVYTSPSSSEVKLAEGDALLQLDALLTRFYSSEVALVRSRTGDDPRPGTWSVDGSPFGCSCG